VEQVGELLRVRFRVPRAWLLAVVAAAAVLSDFEVTRDAQGHLAVGFRVTATTMALVALVWLPALLGVFAVAGGGLKTPAGEATPGGLLDVLKALDPPPGGRSCRRWPRPWIGQRRPPTGPTGPRCRRFARRWREPWPRPYRWTPGRLGGN
jgi:hypothetical protein